MPLSHPHSSSVSVSMRSPNASPAFLECFRFTTFPERLTCIPRMLSFHYVPRTTHLHSSNAPVSPRSSNACVPRTLCTPRVLILPSHNTSPFPELLFILKTTYFHSRFAYFFIPMFVYIFFLPLFLFFMLINPLNPSKFPLIPPINTYSKSFNYFHPFYSLFFHHFSIKTTCTYRFLASSPFCTDLFRERYIQTVGLFRLSRVRTQQTESHT